MAAPRVFRNRFRDFAQNLPANGRAIREKKALMTN
jgi:hypothetical protein